MIKFSSSILLLFLAYSCVTAHAQDSAVTKSWLKEVKKHRKKIHKEYRTEDAPLTEEDKKSFNGLDYYAPDQKYRVVATFVPTPDAKSFQMPTVSTKTKEYKKYGELHFEIDGQKLQLAVYQSLQLMKTEEYKDYLFIPFKDHTNGNETYGGGRYIDMNLPFGETVVLDFNLAYNPYCAYSSGWSCPIPPDENHLNIEIQAGVKAWHDAHEH